MTAGAVDRECFAKTGGPFTALDYSVARVYLPEARPGPSSGLADGTAFLIYKGTDTDSVDGVESFVGYFLTAAHVLDFTDVDFQSQRLAYAKPIVIRVCGEGYAERPR